LLRVAYKLGKSKLCETTSSPIVSLLLLQAKELCLDIIMLRQQKHILEERLRNAEELAKMYAKRLQTGVAECCFVQRRFCSDIQQFQVDFVGFESICISCLKTLEPSESRSF